MSIPVITTKENKPNFNKLPSCYKNSHSLSARLGVFFASAIALILESYIIGSLYGNLYDKVPLAGRIAVLILPSGIAVLTIGVCIWAINSIAKQLLNTQYDILLRKEAGQAIERQSGDILPFPEIKSQYEDLFVRGILDKGDIVALLQKELDKGVSIEGIQKKHGNEILPFLKDDPRAKQLFAEEYLKNPLPDLSFKDIENDNWVNALEVDKAKLKEVLLKRDANHPDYTYEMCVKEYGIDVLKSAVDEIKNPFYTKFQNHVQGLTVREYNEKYSALCKEIWGAEKNEETLKVLFGTQIEKLLKDEITDYAKFRDESCYKRIAETVQKNETVKAKLRACFENMHNSKFFCSSYEDDRKLLGIFGPKVMERYTTWAQNALTSSENNFGVIVASVFFKGLNETLKGELLGRLMGSGTIQFGTKS